MRFRLFTSRRIWWIATQSTRFTTSCAHIRWITFTLSLFRPNITAPITPSVCTCCWNKSKCHQMLYTSKPEQKNIIGWNDHTGCVKISKEKQRSMLTWGCNVKPRGVSKSWPSSETGRPNVLNLKKYFGSEKKHNHPTPPHPPTLR